MLNRTRATLDWWLQNESGAGAQVPCVAVVENMSYFDGHDGTRYRPFGAGSGDRVVADFGLPHLVRFPIVADLSAAGDGAALTALPSCVAGQRTRCRLALNTLERTSLRNRSIA